MQLSVWMLHSPQSQKQAAMSPRSRGQWKPPWWNCALVSPMGVTSNQQQQRSEHQHFQPERFSSLLVWLLYMKKVPHHVLQDPSPWNHGSHGQLPPLNHCDFNLSVWLSVSHNLLSHTAATMHGPQNQIASCFPSEVFFLQGAPLALGTLTLHEDHRFKFSFLTKTARWLVPSTLELRLWEAWSWHKVGGNAQFTPNNANKNALFSHFIISGLQVIFPTSHDPNSGLQLHYQAGLTLWPLDQRWIKKEFRVFLSYAKFNKFKKQFFGQKTMSWESTSW